MAKQTCISPLWLKTLKKSCLALTAGIVLTSCGGGYDGGESFQAPAPTSAPSPVDTPDPTSVPTPEPITKTPNPRQMEYLDRGLVVIPDKNGNSVSWRLLGTDNPSISFDVYRNDNKINESPLTHTTFFKDGEGKPDDRYQVRGIVDGAEVAVSKSVQPWSAAYHSIDLNRPMDGRIGDEKYTYVANDASAADLDGDGQYEIILKWMPADTMDNQVNGGARDNSQSGITGNVYIDAYTIEGTQLWRIDLGKNIRAGAHYNPFMVYDFDGDGRAELAVKTADGTVDGRGVVIGDEDADYRNSSGYILDGPEFLTMFDGLSGEALDTVSYAPPRGVVGDWGDAWGNRVDRFMAAVAYLDGKKPSLVMTRGVYTRVVLAAYDWANGAFSQRWVFDSDDGGASAAMFGQGNHSLSVGDVDGDGKDEIIYGAGAIDDNGSILYVTGLCDGDALHMGDFNPDRAGLEVFTPHETRDCYKNDEEGYNHGVEMHDAATGEILWSLPGPVSGNGDIGRGVTVDIDPLHPGNESWASAGGLTAADGTNIGSVKPSSTNFAVWWEGDLLRELLDGTRVSKWNYLGSEDYTIFDAASDGAVSNNGTKATPSLSADLFGDWREEIVWANSSHNKLMIYSTTHSTSKRMHTLMHDPQYRLAIAWQNAGYNQPPHPGFYIGPGASLRWQSDIATVEGQEWAKFVAQGNDENVEVRTYTKGFNVSGIEIFRDTDSDPAGRVSIGTLAGDERVFVDSTAVPDVDYYYWAELSGSTASTSIDLTSSRTKLTSTLLPSHWVQAIPSVGKVGPIKIVWETRNIDISAINIYRVEAASADETPNAEGRSLVGSPDVTATEWIDTTGVKDTAYFYWVEFVDTEAQATYKPAPRYGEYLPIPVIELTAEYVDNSIQVNWRLEDFRPDINSVEVYRNIINSDSGRVRVMRSAPRAGTFVDNVAPTSSTAPDPAMEGIRYWYTLKVVLKENGSRPVMPIVPEEGVIIPVGEGLPIVGAWGEVVKDSDPLKMEVFWKSYHIDIQSIEIFRGTNTDGSDRVSVGAPAASASSWVDESPTPGLTYYYWVEILDTNKELHTSEMTNPVSLPPKTNLVTELVNGQIQVSWDLQNFPLVFNKIQLYRNTKDQLNGRTLLGTVQANGSFVDDGSVAALTDGQDYWYMFKINDGAFNTDPEGKITYTE